ncbi:hypothetical protein QMO56_26295 [Roseomonas sp. E05]|uniref:hypothetical protein n=1 Tax=Roseomonas sp. E05 TaxID=3046310 RepID=UPI0024B8DB3E|nr:hypothetical protein [Roseomonas sp. E05]MDJ0391617.1 hypothetical protein [Roseomonas sp. E05]
MSLLASTGRDGSPPLGEPALLAALAEASAAVVRLDAVVPLHPLRRGGRPRRTGF